MKTKVPEILRLGTPDAPKAILIITAHWEESVPTISEGIKPSLLYDYYGFPPECYNLQYDAPGSPEVAKEIFQVMEKAGLEPKMDKERGWDHGVFIPLLMINPAANIPIIQMSVLPPKSEADSTARLLKMGAALSTLRDANVAIVGSGSATMHNMRAFRVPGFRDGKETQIKQFSEKLTAAVSIEDLEERGKALSGWRQFPGADICHPPQEAEHLYPLFVCAGAGGNAKAKTWIDKAFGEEFVSYYWD